MNPPAASISLTVKTSAKNPDIIFNATTQEIIARKPLKSTDNKADIEFKCKFGNESSTSSLTIAINVKEVNNMGPIWKVDTVPKNETAASFDENRKGAITFSQRVKCDGRDDNPVDFITLQIRSSRFSVS